MILLDFFLPYGHLTDGILKISDTFSVTCTPKEIGQCMRLRALASYTGEYAPKLRISLTVKEQSSPLYESHDYRIGKKSEYIHQAWRIPPLLEAGMTVKIQMNIPEGTILGIRYFEMAQDICSNNWNGGLRYNAHLGFYGLAPNNTMPAFELAAMCGFPACIVVPKVTCDGVLVCIHDDTINKTARDDNGCPPREPIYVWDKTYNELLEWEYGSYKNEIYKGTRMPLLSDFFDLCMKTGMCPMFSTHPGLTVEQWEQVKDMLKHRGLLKNFHIKSFEPEILQTAYSVFGTEIDGYTYDIKKWDNAHIDILKNIGIDTGLCRVGIEVRFQHYTEQIAKTITSAGFFAAAFGIGRRDFSKYEQLISWGVTEFTEDNHCSMGLNY